MSAEPRDDLNSLSDRGLSLAVEREVFGRGGVPADACGICSQVRERRHVPNYAGDIGAAWTVVARLRAWIGFSVTLDQDAMDDDWQACFTGTLDENADVEVNVEATALTAPRAICVAALKAVRAAGEARS